MLRASRTFGLLVAAAVACAGLASAGPAAAPAPARRTPMVEARLVDGARGTRGVFACRGASREATLELDGGIVPFGARPIGPRTAATVARREGLVSCTDDGVRGAVRLRPLQLRAVTPSYVRDPAGARIVLAIDGQALGPRVGSDDDVYLIWRGTLIAAAALAGKCPEARWSDERVIVCLDPARVRGRGPVRVRIQSAGRLEEAGGAAVDLERVGEAQD